MLAGTIPFLSFWAERKVTQRMGAAAAAAGEKSDLTRLNNARVPAE